MNQREALEHPFPSGSYFDQDLAPIETAGRPANEAPMLQTVDQLDRAVMAEHKTFREVTHRGCGAGGNTSQGQQQLMLRRIDPRVARRTLAEVEKLADPISKLRQRPVVGL